MLQLHKIPALVKYDMGYAFFGYPKQGATVT